ncbi:hypothetical protein KDL44_01970 [bacterium]|nr:hypothetical protein [bacterium]
MRIRADKIASATRGLKLDALLSLGTEISCVEGSVVACRVLNDKSTYRQLEDVHGRMTSVKRGDVIVGVLGNRQALHGYEGHVPLDAAVGDRLQLLNLGGVIGVCTSANPEVGPPFELELLGQVQTFPGFQSRKAVAASISQPDTGLPELSHSPALLIVCGSCMNSGKTVAASAIVSELNRLGLHVAGAKLTGVSLLRDVLSMQDYGAREVMDFTDAGFPSTVPGNAVLAARRVICGLSPSRPDLIVVEMGDGIFGSYGVQEILDDPAVSASIRMLVYCANDPAGAFGGVLQLREKHDLQVNVVSGPVTDNQVGRRFIEEQLQLPAINARLDAAALGGLAASVLEEHSGKEQPDARN